MKKEIEIVKSLLFPLVEEGINNLSKNINWQVITSGFVLYEIDAKVLYAEIYKLELIDPEKIISNLPELYESFVDEMAQEFVLGRVNDAITSLLKHDIALFSKKVEFYRTLKNVVTKQERQRIINELPSFSDRIDFSLSDDGIASAVKKKARADLTDKFDKWDKELVEKEFELASSYENLSPMLERKHDGIFNAEKGESKVISLSWAKYAVAVSIVIAAGLFYFKSFNSIDNIVNTIANVETSTQTVSIIVDRGLGYISDESNQQIEVVFIDYTARIVSINKLINANVSDNMAVYNKELDSLKLIENTYFFNKNQLNLYSKNQQIRVIYLNEKDLYLGLNNMFYKIVQTDSPTDLFSENDQRIIEQIEKLIFENE